MYEVRSTIYEVRCTRFDLPMPKGGGRDFELAGEPAVWNCRGRACPASVRSTDGGGMPGPGLRCDAGRARLSRADGLMPPSAFAEPGLQPVVGRRDGERPDIHHA